MTPARLRPAALALTLAASAPWAAAAPTQGDQPVRVRWEFEPTSPRTGEVFAASVVVELDAEWAEGALVQLFPQPLDVPLQIEGFAAERGALEWLGPAGLEPGADPALDARATLATVAVEGQVRGAIRTSASPGVVRLEIRRLARAPRGGVVVLAAPRVSYSAATAFRDDLLRGRVPIDPVAGEASGDGGEVTIRQLPEDGRPPQFTGAIGRFTLRAAPVEGAVRSGDAFAVTVFVGHDRPLAPGVRPRLTEPGPDLAVLGSVPADPVAGSSGESGFRFSLVAARDGSVELPTAELFAFDPAEGAYRRHAVDLGTLDVLPPESSAPPRAETSDGTGSAPADDGDGADLRWTLAVLAALFGLAVLSVVRRRGGPRVRGVLAGAHVAVFGHDPIGASTGTAVAARSLVRRLRARGLRVSFVEPGDDPEGLPAPTLCHAFHAGPAATRAADCAAGSGARLVITVTGDDVDALQRGDAGDEVRANLERADAVVATAAGHVAALAHLGVHATRIGQAVDVDLIDLANGYADEGALRERVGRTEPDVEVAMALGGLRPAKGQLLALDAFAELARRRAPEAARWHLAIVGDDLDGAYADAVRARAAALPNVSILPSLPHGEALVALAAATALVDTRDGEGESRAILEAQALQVPVLARRGPGNASLVEDGESGRLFGDARDLADALEMLLVDPGVAARIREGALAAARARGSVEDEIAATIGVYETAVASPPAPGSNTTEDAR